MSDKAEKKQPQRRGLDVELQAMAKIDRILSDLPSQAAQVRVLLWVQDKNRVVAELPVVPRGAGQEAKP